MNYYLILSLNLTKSLKMIKNIVIYTIIFFRLIFMDKLYKNVGEDSG